jgi:hypothetical protein
VSHELFFILIIKRGRVGGDLHGSVVILLEFNENFAFQIVSVVRVQIRSGVIFGFARWSSSDFSLHKDSVLSCSLSHMLRCSDLKFTVVSLAAGLCRADLVFFVLPDPARV